MCAEPDDVEALVALRDDVAQWLLRRDIQQWLPGEFSAARMQAWVERGDVFVHRQDGQVAAAVAVLDEDPEIWDDDHDGAAYIHLLMVDRAHAGVGLGDAALAFAEEQVRYRGGRVARLDAVASNAELRRWYQARGYRVVGSRAFEEPELFDSVLLEKALSQRSVSPHGEPGPSTNDGADFVTCPTCGEVLPGVATACPDDGTEFV